MNKQKLMLTFLEENHTLSGTLGYYGGQNDDSMIYLEVVDRQHQDAAERIEQLIEADENEGLFNPEIKQFSESPALVKLDAQRVAYRLDCLAKSLRKHKHSDDWLSDDLRDEVLLSDYLLKSAKAKRKR